MALPPWYKVVTLRREVREGRSFSPDEFAIALEQVVAKTAPEDYRDPAQFFSRTCFTRALKEHSGMVLRRLSGKTGNTAPVLTLITQFGGGKTHTLTALYHLANAGASASRFPGVADLLNAAGMAEAPSARVGVFVGNAWDPAEGRETPWIDVARQLGGERGVAALGASARTTPPGTVALSKVFAAAEAPVLLLFDEVLNFVNRHRRHGREIPRFPPESDCGRHGDHPGRRSRESSSQPSRNDRLGPAVAGPNHQGGPPCGPRPDCQRRIRDQRGGSPPTVRGSRQAAHPQKGLPRPTRTGASNGRPACLPSGCRWIRRRAEAKAREFLRARFEACYPFHPATLSVFQRKWRAMPQFQQTRGALALLAQWISWAAGVHFREARTEPLITLGSAPLDVPEFRAVVLGQLGEARLDAAIDADLAGTMAHAKALDQDTRGALRAIHRRVGTAILFESSGGQLEKVAHLPELRFALGEPQVDTTSIDNAAAALESKGFFLRRVGTDGYRIHHQATLKKVVSDRRASLDEETEIQPALRKLVENEFKAHATVPIVFFPGDSAAVQDSPRLTLVVIDPNEEWSGGGQIAEQIGQWTRSRGKSPRLYPGSLVWCARKPGRELRAKVELWLAWKRVAREVAQGVLGAEYDRADRSEVVAKVKDSEEAAKDEAWAGYRFVALSETDQPNGLKTIDLGAGHASASETLCGRIIGALKSEALLNESVGAGYIDRHWPPAFEDTGAWPLTSLRQSFLNGALTRLIDPDRVLGQKLVEFVGSGDFGLASGSKNDGSYGRLWYEEPVQPEEVAFEADVFLLTKAKAAALKTGGGAPPSKPQTPPTPPPKPKPGSGSGSVLKPDPATQRTTLRLAGAVPTEVWNRLGTRILPKLRSGEDLSVRVDFSVSVGSEIAQQMETELKQILHDLGLADRVRVERSETKGSDSEK